MRCTFWRFVQIVVATDIILLFLGTLVTNTIPEKRYVSVNISNSSNTVSSLHISKRPRVTTELAKAVNVSDETYKLDRPKWARNVIFENGSIFRPWKALIPDGYSAKPKIVLGIPTVKREKTSYLLDTLKSVLDNKGEISEFIIVVYVGEDNNELVKRTEMDIAEKFSKELKDGVIHIVKPPENFYPDWESELHGSFGDPLTRTKWRSKQNLDQIALMMYVYFLQPEYYLMLEDDIITSNNYLDIIYKDAQEHRDKKTIILSYCQLGAIGKLFSRDILPSVATFLSLFWGDKPLDWLLLDYVRSRVCSYDESEKQCNTRMYALAFVTYKPSLFQHIGKESSFPGKIQNLKDAQFKKP